MYLPILNLFDIPNITWSSYVTFLIPVPTYFSISQCQKHVCSYIKFSLIVQQWIRNVALEYYAFLFTLFSAVYDSFSDFLKFVGTWNAVSSVWKLSWLNDPIVLLFLFLLQLENGMKTFVLLILKPIFNMKSKRNNVKYIFVCKFVILS